MAAANRRNIVLGAALVATLALVVWVESRDQAGDEIALAHPERELPAATSSVAVTTAQVTSVLDWPALDGRTVDTEKSSADLFKSHSWYVPPPPKPAGPPPPPPKPVAPPAPFSYLGKMEDTPQGTLMILSGSNRVYTVAVGETIDKTWRVDGEDTASVRLTYLPLGLPQTLAKAGKPAAAKPNDLKKTENQGTDS